jgi:hypothetical protein
VAKFADEVTAFVRKTPQRMEAVFKESVQRTVEYMQGPNMPVDTGFLRASIRGNPGRDPQQLTLPYERDPSGSYAYNAQQVNLAITGSTLTSGFIVVYLANYARAQEYGSNGRAGRRFVGLAVQRWPQIVREAAADLEKRIMTNG